MLTDMSRPLAMTTTKSVAICGLTAITARFLMTAMPFPVVGARTATITTSVPVPGGRREVIKTAGMGSEGMAHTVAEGITAEGTEAEVHNRGGERETIHAAFGMWSHAGRHPWVVWFFEQPQIAGVLGWLSLHQLATWTGQQKACSQWSRFRSVREGEFIAVS